MKRSDQENPGRSATPRTALPPALESMVRDGRLFHSIMIEGEPGLGRKTLAVNLAAAVLCDEGAAGPCGGCLPCRKVLGGVHPDVMLIDPNSDPDAYKMKPLRETLSAAWLRPSEGRAKVFVLTELQRMERDAQNILLKVIEEPPADTYFFFTCDNRYRLLPTILSRAVTIPLERPDKDTCVRRLEALVPGKNREDYEKAWRLTGGSPGQSAALLTDSAAARRWEKARDGVAALAREDAFGAIAAITPFEKNRLDYAAYLETAAAVAANRTLWPELGLTPEKAASLGLHIRDIIRRSGENVYLPLASALFGGWHWPK